MSLNESNTLLGVKAMCIGHQISGWPGLYVRCCVYRMLNWE